ncbi:GGDEF domain-containing protein [Bradyrhizobium sp.]|uniref:GGDEF domain-containing protein n=1 Tax=Bradyrhizobium sp. TaxID=376 RepID=UPI0023A2EA39|nr:GGDEF domain-containing protein [Bradyrhizobium sp.]MDE2377052.1 GGDEF domain-containing protein [Bradyrhizobium sp.]
MKKRKRAVAAKARVGRKGGGIRSRIAAAKPARRSDDAGRAQTTIRGLRSKLTAALRRIEELEAAADTDFLLGIPNRRGFERELHRAIGYINRYRAGGALIVLDVDRLKPINDVFGHAAGDEVLKAIAAMLTRQVRSSDMVGRLGGDEFALLLWNLSETDAKAKAAALERAIDEMSFTFGGKRVNAGASAGVALLGPHAQAGRALERADAAMYARKAQRRHEARS